MCFYFVLLISCRWRGRLQAVLHNHWLHVVIVFLVALDALIVIFELLLDIGAFSKSIISYYIPAKSSFQACIQFHDVCGSL